MAAPEEFPLSRLPRVGVVYDSLSASPRALYESSAGLCEPVLLTKDSTVPASVRDLLRNLVTIAPLEDAQSLGLSAVTTFSESAIVQTATLADELGLAWASRAAAAAMTTKTLQRRVLLDHGVDDTGFNALATAADLVALEGGSLSLPMVIKPDSGFGSRDVTVVHSAEQLAGTGRRVLASGTPYIAEELLVGDLARVGTSWGPYCSVEMLSYGMRHLPIAVVGRGRLQAGFKETANIHPSTLESDDLKSVVELAAQALTSLGPVYGCTHTEIMLTPSGPRIIEINGRLGGGIAPLLRESLGIDVIRLALACALGEAPSVDRVTGVGAFGWIALYPEPEFVERVPFSQLRADLLRDPNVISVAAQHRYVRNFFADSSSHSVEAIVRAPDHDQLSRTIERAVRLVDGIFQ